ncbi:MAG: hypothetical protein IJK54_05070, partial [Clostridia bacterium]|nr:hypothetical protein [Clostridia bacterium]
DALVGQIADAMRMELLPSGGETLSIGDIERLIEKEEKRLASCSRPSRAIRTSWRAPTSSKQSTKRFRRSKAEKQSYWSV